MMCAASGTKPRYHPPLVNLCRLPWIVDRALEKLADLQQYLLRLASLFWRLVCLRSFRTSDSTLYRYVPLTLSLGPQIARRELSVLHERILKEWMSCPAETKILILETSSHWCSIRFCAFLVPVS